MSNQPTWQRPAECDSGACAEVTVTPRGIVIIRNSQDPARMVWLTPPEWDAFAMSVKAGEFDHLTNQ